MSKTPRPASRARRPDPANFLVRVPATTANLGPGFDCLGMALDLFNDFHIMRIERGTPLITGSGACEGLSARRNIFFDAYKRVFRLAGARPVPVHVHVSASVPMARGLGSSATAIAAGVVAANVILGGRFPMETLLLEAAREEGHPDNVAPALLGGLVAAVLADDRVVAHRADPHPGWRLALFVPDYPLSTEKARRAIPKTIPHKDAVFNLTRVPLVMECLLAGRAADLSAVLQDRLHEPYRKGLIRGWNPIRAAGVKAGAAAVYLSGAGPSLAAFCMGADSAGAVARAMKSAARRAGISGESMILKPYSGGTLVLAR